MRGGVQRIWGVQEEEEEEEEEEANLRGGRARLGGERGSRD